MDTYQYIFLEHGFIYNIRNRSSSLMRVVLYISRSRTDFANDMVCDVI